MKHFPLILSLFALVMLGSCTEELASVTTSPEPEEELVPEQVDVNTNRLAVSMQELTIQRAYLSTTYLPEENLYEHHILLTENGPGNDVPEGGAFAFSVFSEAADLDLNAAYTDRQVTDPFHPRGIYMPSFDITQSDNYSFTGYEIIPIFQESTDGTITIDLKNTSSSTSHLSGTISLPLDKLSDVRSSIPDLPVVAGENFFRFSDEEWEAGHAYLEKKGTVPGGDYYHLYIANDEVGASGQLLGVTDLFLIPIQIPAGQELSGTMKLHQPMGYTGSLRNNEVKGYFCRNMDFSLGFADDDEPTNGGEAILILEDGHVSAHWSFVTQLGILTTGFYDGDLVVVE